MPVVIDARSNADYASGHIPGAISLSIRDIELDGPKRPDLIGQRIITYGQNPGDPLAAGLTLRLLDAGYDDVRFFRGGIDAWTDSGRELDTPE